MIFSEFHDLRLSLLGFGCMRLPTMELGNGIDIEQVGSMVDAAIESGINYFDTAWTYHKSLSEVVIGRSLSRHPRDSWNLATKFPGHQYLSSYDAKSIFEKQLKNAVSSISISTYFTTFLRVLTRHMRTQNGESLITSLSRRRLEGYGTWVSPPTEDSNVSRLLLQAIKRRWSSAKSSLIILTGLCKTQNQNMNS